MRRYACVMLLVVLGFAPPARAQLNTQHVKGASGQKAGSQPPPGGYVVAPMLYFYNSDEVRDRDGNRLPNVNAHLGSTMFGAGYAHVTTKKILGGLYGFQVLFPVGANNRIQGTEIDADPGAGITDSVIEPISLGWHGKRYDAIASYTIFIPTGRYEDGAANNTGLGMWGQELGFGTTVYLTETRQFHASTLATFDFQSKKEDSETKVGNAMNLEGGIGGDFLRGRLTLGLSYYASFKLQEDHIEGFPQILIRGKNRVFGLGPDATLALERKNTIYGFVRVAFQWEMAAHTNTQGTGLNIGVTWLVKPLKIPTP
jgi:hypothetical protein